MSYYISNTLKNISFSDAIDKTVAALKKEGFGVLTEIDIKSTLKNKLDANFYNDTILEPAILEWHIKPYRQKIKLEPCCPAM